MPRALAAADRATEPATPSTVCAPARASRCTAPAVADRRMDHGRPCCSTRSAVAAARIPTLGRTFPAACATRGANVVPLPDLRSKRGASAREVAAVCDAHRRCPKGPTAVIRAWCSHRATAAPTTRRARVERRQTNLLPITRRAPCFPSANYSDAGQAPT